MGKRKRLTRGLKLAQRLVSGYGLPIPHSISVESAHPLLVVHYFLLLDEEAASTVEGISEVLSVQEWKVLSTTVSTTVVIDNIEVDVRLFVPAKDRWTPELRDALMRAGWHGANRSEV